MEEIERKWILKSLPSEVTGQTPVQYERHFLFIGNGIEIRIQKKGDKFEFERKVENNDLTRTGQEFEITESEFNHLKKNAIASLLRESYLITGTPEISIKVYKGIHTGLIRAEVEFNDEDSAKGFNPPSWFGQEVTDTDLGKDKKLSQLTEEQFTLLIKNYG